MKRDIDLARKILFIIEECEYADGPQLSLTIDGYDEQTVNYHIGLLKQAGLIEAEENISLGSPSVQYTVGNITWKGHEFLDSARTDAIWNKAKNRVLERTGSLAFDALRYALTHLSLSETEKKP